MILLKLHHRSISNPDSTLHSVVMMLVTPTLPSFSAHHFRPIVINRGFQVSPFKHPPIHCPVVKLSDCSYRLRDNSIFYCQSKWRARFQYLHPVLCSSLSRDLPTQPSISSADVDRKLAVVFWSATTLLMSVSNRVFHKLALVPMKSHPLFLALLNSFMYVAVYFSILHMRHRSGIATDEMLAIPKSPFIAIGFLESISIVGGMYAVAMLPGPAIPILQQTFLVWQLMISSILLSRRYSLNQIVGCFLVGAGVVVAVASGSNSGRMLSGINIMWPLLMIVSSGFQAGASIVKESVFVDAATRFKGNILDVFVVNSFGSGFQAFFILLLLPVLASLKGIPLLEMASHLKSGAVCFLNIGTTTTACSGAPLLPLLYIISNIFFNISILNLVKASNAIIASLAVRASVPLSVYVLSLELPYLGSSIRLSNSFHLGSLILVVGLFMYNINWPNKNDPSTLPLGLVDPKIKDTN